MSECRGCGARIDWVRTAAGKNMPVDHEPVQVIEGDGKERFVTAEGAVITGRRARPDEERRGGLVGFLPHWRTCPNAADFRRK